MLVGQQASGEALAFADALDLDGGRFDDPFDSLDAVEELRIAGRFHYFLLSAVLAEEIGARKGTGEDADAREYSDQCDDYSEVAGHGPPVRMGEAASFRGRSTRKVRSAFPGDSAPADYRRKEYV